MPRDYVTEEKVDIRSSAIISEGDSGKLFHGHGDPAFADDLFTAVLRLSERFDDHDNHDGLHRDRLRRSPRATRSPQEADPDDMGGNNRQEHGGTAIRGATGMGK